MSSQSPEVCLICYEDVVADDKNLSFFSLRQCSHMFCGKCLVQWLETAETTTAPRQNNDDSRPLPPGCPSCDTPMTWYETRAILGRRFSPGKTRAILGPPSTPDITEKSPWSWPNAITADHDMDELTRRLLEETTRPCPHCGVWIAKVNDTCDKMMCLCGHQFCYRCSAPGAACSCSENQGHHWYCNATTIPYGMGQVWRDGELGLVAQPDKRTGHIDLQRHYHQVAVRNQRQSRRAQNEFESELPLMGSAQWLFASSSRAAALDMLSRQTAMVMDYENCRPCPACEIWTTHDCQLLPVTADPDIRPVHAQATFVNNICRCSCRLRYCFWCGVTNPREEEFCEHGWHKCDYNKLIRHGCEWWVYNGIFYGRVCYKCDVYVSEFDQLEDNSWDGQFDRDGQKHSYGGRKTLLWKGNQKSSSKKGRKQQQPSKNTGDNDTRNNHAKRAKAKRALIDLLQSTTS
jgi:hypothetical protein